MAPGSFALLNAVQAFGVPTLARFADGERERFRVLEPFDPYRRLLLAAFPNQPSQLERAGQSVQGDPGRYES